MSRREELTQLQLRKQALILESHLNRYRLQTEWRQLRQGGRQLTQPFQAWRSASPWLLLLAPIAGFLAFRAARRPSQSLHRVVSAIKLGLTLLTLWTRFQRATAHPESKSPAQPPAD